VSIRVKVVLWVLLSLVFLLFIALLFSLRGMQVILRENLKEEGKALKEYFAVLFEEGKESLVRTLFDYTRWTDMGEKGVEERDPLWLAENLNPWAKEQFGYEVLLITQNGEVITRSPDWDIPREKWVLPSHSFSVDIVGSARGVWLVATAQVTDNEGRKNYPAFLSFAKLLDTEPLTRWGKILGVELVLRGPHGEYSTHPGFHHFTWDSEEDFFHHDGYVYIPFALVSHDGEEVGELLFRKVYCFPSSIHIALWRIFIGTLLLFVAFSLVLVWFLNRHIFSPLCFLENYTQKVAQGEYDLDCSFERDDEIGRLTASFLTMAQALKVREKDLEIEKRKAEKLALLDALTRVPNRRYLERCIKGFMEARAKFAFVFVDLDKFKTLNDLLGHHEGDRFLRQIAHWFERNVRRGDIVARYGGDEFCLLFPGLGRDEAQEIMERLHHRFTRETLFTKWVKLGFSYGIAIYPDEAQDLDVLLAQSDQEMYRQKRRKSVILPNENG